MKNKLSIIIITLNEEKNIGNILSDLSRQSFQNFEVIVSDSNSSDSTQKVAESFKNKFQEFTFKNCGKTLGPSYGRNYGVQYAKYERLLFLDADTRIPDRDFLKKFITIVTEKNIEAGAMYMHLTNTGILERMGYGFINAGLFITQYFSPTAVGACMFSTKTAHAKIGGFREEVQLGEDSDYVRDLRRNGVAVQMVPLFYDYSNRRLKKEGLIRVTNTYLKAIFIRLTTGNSISKEQIEYKYGEY